MPSLPANQESNFPKRGRPKFPEPAGVTAPRPRRRPPLYPAVTEKVGLHGGQLFCMNNRRIYCIRNWTAPKECRISIKLHRSPHDFDQVYGHGVFDRYYSTTCSGEDITVTEHGTASAGKWPTLAHGKSRVAANQGRQGSRRVPKTVPRRRPGPTPQRPSVGRLQPTWLSRSWTSWSGFPLRRRGPERCQGRRVQVVRYLVGERAAVVGLEQRYSCKSGIRIERYS